MAQILKQPPSASGPPGRISQVLPSVKCSNCNFPVPLDELGDHVCSVPPVPKPTISPGSAVSLLPTRLQNLVLPPPRSSSSRSPSSGQPSSPSQSSTQDNASQKQRPGQPPSLSQVPRLNQPVQDQHIRSPLYRTEPTLLRDSHTQERARTPIVQSPFYAQDRAQASSTTQSPSPRPDSQRGGLHAYAQERGRASSVTQNSFPRSETPKVPPPLRDRYSSERSKTPPATQRDRELYSPLVNSSPLRNGSLSNAGSMPAAPRTPHPSENVAHPLHTTNAPPRDNDIDTKIGGEAGMAGVGRRGFAAAARAAMTGPSNESARHIPGMDGRRANAPSYLNITSLHPATPPLSPNSHSSPSHSPSPISPPVLPSAHNNDNSLTPSRSPSPSIQFMPSEPQIIASINNPDHGSAPGTPRLPFFEKYKNNLPGSPNVSLSAVTRTRTPPGTKVQPPRQPAVHFVDHHRNRGNASNRIPSPSPSLDSEYGLAYADSTCSEAEEKDGKPRRKPPPPLSLPKVKGLAMAEKSVKGPPLPDRIIEGLSKSTSSASGKSIASASGGVQADKNGPASIARALGLTRVPVQGQGRYSGGPGGPDMTRDRSGSSGSINSANRRDLSATSSVSGSSVYSKSTGTGTGTGGLERAMETLLEDIASTPNVPGPISAGLTKSQSSSSAASASSHSLINGTTGKSYRSKTVRSPEAKAPKLPTRSRTSPTITRDSGNASKRSGVEERVNAERTREKRKRQCVKCQMNIEDGRWVQMDEGSVLCEKCWKNMYLPKCRRCNLPIENQAVSSSDGQLKGKYHRACFNCHTCHKPFPDKTFYVFDGRPLCAYHYHESNNSLCTAARCGQPIEGPCAVSHAGDRYHPEHFLCEYAGYRPCRERLMEYWEVDGMMLCERHANKEMNADADLDESPMPSTRAMKRVTRFIDLTGGGGSGSNAF